MADGGTIVMIDASSLRTHPHGATGNGGGEEHGNMGRSCGSLTPKIPALVETEGRPVRRSLTPGRAGDAPPRAN